MYIYIYREREIDRYTYYCWACWAGCQKGQLASREIRLFRRCPAQGPLRLPGGRKHLV